MSAVHALIFRFSTGWLNKRDSIAWGFVASNFVSFKIWFSGNGGEEESNIKELKKVEVFSAWTYVIFAKNDDTKKQWMVNFYFNVRNNQQNCWLKKLVLY